MLINNKDYVFGDSPKYRPLPSDIREVSEDIVTYQPDDDEHKNPIKCKVLQHTPSKYPALDLLQNHTTQALEVCLRSHIASCCACSIANRLSGSRMSRHSNPSLHAAIQMSRTAV